MFKATVQLDQDDQRDLRATMSQWDKLKRLRSFYQKLREERLVEFDPKIPPIPVVPVPRRCCALTVCSRGSWPTR